MILKIGMVEDVPGQGNIFIVLKGVRMRIGFIGLGNVGGKLAGSLLRNNFDLTVRDIDENLTNPLKDLGAKVAKSPKELAEKTDLIITSLPLDTKPTIEFLSPPSDISK